MGIISLLDADTFYVHTSNSPLVYFTRFLANNTITIANIIINVNSIKAMVTI